jgi:lipopolysaccharide biosynthesis glycosyltransferase
VYKYHKHIRDLGLLPEEYIYAGNIIMNSSLMREDGVVPKFIKEAGHSKYKYQDMDILNIVCKGKIKIIAPEFCLSMAVRECAMYQKEQSIYTKQELEDSLQYGIVHYTGPKPWVRYCPDFDIWWEYYRKSIFFDQKYYFDFFNRKMNEYDFLPLWKRIKILVRWFVFRPVK